MKFLVDMNRAPAWCDVLRGAGWEVHWSLVGAPDATDAEIMSRARSDDYIVFTHDLDFGAILASAGSGKPSVVQIRAQDVTPAAPAKRYSDCCMSIARLWSEVPLLRSTSNGLECAYSR